MYKPEVEHTLALLDSLFWPKDRMLSKDANYTWPQRLSGSENQYCLRMLHKSAKQTPIPEETIRTDQGPFVPVVKVLFL